MTAPGDTADRTADLGDHIGFEHTWTSVACVLRGHDGSRSQLPMSRWRGTSRDSEDLAFDHEVVSRCTGPTIDLGCGPGRLVQALVTTGTAALGVDAAHAAVAVARERGVPVLQRNIFDRLPGEGRWANALLIDGNIGIGGDPARLLGRVATLLRPEGIALIEVDPDVPHRRTDFVRTESAEHTGPWFRWTRVGPDGLSDLLPQYGMRAGEMIAVGERRILEVMTR